MVTPASHGVDHEHAASDLARSPDVSSLHGDVVWLLGLTRSGRHQRRSCATCVSIWSVGISPSTASR
jgi:hypothetical protein